MPGPVADWSFCPALADLIRDRRTVGQSGRVFDDVGAVSTEQNLTVLRSLMLEHRPSRTLEIGLSFGGSALAIAATHRDLGHQPAAQHVALDPYQSTVWDNSAAVSLRRAGLDGFVDVREEFSCTALPALLTAGQSFDLIYVDGSHLFEDVFVDAYFGFQLLADKGVMLFDDCTIDHVARVLAFVTTNWNEWTGEIDLSAYRSSGGDLRYVMARQLGRVQLRGFRRTRKEMRNWDAPLARF